MERLALCSKVLYERDLVQTKKELYTLKCPKIFFKSYNESETFKNNFYETIEKTIRKNIQQSNEYTFRITHGAIGRICDCIKTELLKFTKNEEWVENLSFVNVWNSIEGLFHSLHHIWETIYEFTDRESIGEMVYQNVFWYFDSVVFNEMVQFHCTSCKQDTDYLDEITDVCYTCSN
jgi:hypothetical protein